MKQALITWGGWKGHEPKLCGELFGPILEEAGFEVDISDTMEVYLDADRMQALDLIVPIWTMSTITDEQEAGLLEAIKKSLRYLVDNGLASG